MHSDPGRTRGERGQDLQKSVERMRSVIENAPAVLFLLDCEGVVTLSAGKGLESFGMRPGNTVGESALQMEDLPDVVENVR